MPSRVNFYSGRNTFLLFLLFLGFSFLFLRLVYIHLYQDSFLEERSYSKLDSAYQIPARRGKILDRNGKLLALDIINYSIEIDRLIFDVDSKKLISLSREIDIKLEKLRSQILSSPSRYVKIKKALNKESINNIKKLNLNGLSIIENLKRSYPQGEAFSHVVGLTDPDRNGLQGVELIFDNLLKGINGSFKGSKGTRGKKLEGDREDPIDGLDIYLTIDSRLQSIAYLELSKIMNETQASFASVIIVNPLSSEILSLISLPSFNPNNRKNIKDVSVFRNRSTLDIFEPGSVMKPLAMSAILESGLIDKNALINTSPGWIEYGGYKTKDFRDYGVLSLKEIISKSSNVGMVKLCDKQDKDHLLEFFSDFGLDSDLANILIPSTQGFLPRYSAISERDKVSFCYGYGLSISAVHIAQAYSVIANSGVFQELNLFLNKDLSSLESPRRILSKETSKNIQEMLIQTVNSQYGTGKNARVEGLIVAGKTGTAESLISDQKVYTATFSGYAPSENPSLLIVVVLRGLKGDIHSGGAVAAPTFSKIMDKSIRTIELGF